MSGLPELETVTVPLTRSQKRRIDALMAKAAAAADGGLPGMVLAQIFGDHMRVGFLPSGRAALLATKDSNGNARIVRTARD